MTSISCLAAKMVTEQDKQCFIHCLFPTIRYAERLSERKCSRQVQFLHFLHCVSLFFFHCLSPRNVSWWEFWKHGARNASPQCQTAQSASSLAAPKATDSLIIGFSVESKHRSQRLKRLFCGKWAGQPTTWCLKKSITYLMRAGMEALNNIQARYSQINACL